MKNFISNFLGAGKKIKTLFVREFEELDKEGYNQGP